MKQSKVSNDLQRLLETQNFKDINELNAFFEKYKSEPIPEFAEEALTDNEKAEDLIFKAYESPKDKGFKLAEEALKLDKDCIMAYQFMGDRHSDFDASYYYYKKGIEIGKNKFGGKYEVKNKGHFWMIHETRPYMTCIFNLSECEYRLGNIDEAIKLQEYLIELNPNDNQGVRYILSSHLLRKKLYKKHQKLLRDNKDDGGIFFKFNKALHEYIDSGDSLKANKLLTEAIEHNAHVVPNLNKNIQSLSERYTLGSKDEAEYYLEYNGDIWINTPGAIEWAKIVTKQ